MSEVGLEIGEIVRRLQGLPPPGEEGADGAAAAAPSADAPSQAPVEFRELHPLEFLGRLAAQWRDGYARRGDEEQADFWRVQHRILSQVRPYPNPNPNPNPNLNPNQMQLLKRTSTINGGGEDGGDDGDGGGGGGGGGARGGGGGDGFVGKVVPTNMLGSKPPPYTINGDIYDI